MAALVFQKRNVIAIFRQLRNLLALGLLLRPCGHRRVFDKHDQVGGLLAEGLGVLEVKLDRQVLVLGHVRGEVANRLVHLKVVFHHLP